MPKARSAPSSGGSTAAGAQNHGSYTNACTKRLNTYMPCIKHCDTSEMPVASVDLIDRKSEEPLLACLCLITVTSAQRTATRDDRRAYLERSGKRRTP